MAVVCDVIFSPLQIVSLKQVEHLGHALGVLGHDLNGPAGLGVHGGKPHHIRLVFAQSLGPVSYTHLDVYKRQMQPSPFGYASMRMRVLVKSIPVLSLIHIFTTSSIQTP